MSTLKRLAFGAWFLLLAACFLVGQTPTSKPSANVYQPRDGVKPPRPISTPTPEPPDSTPTDKQVKVRISFVVAPDGSVTDIKLLKRATPDFDKFAIETVSKWKFEPATKDGTAVAFRLEAEVHSHQ